MLMFILII